MNKRFVNVKMISGEKIEGLLVDENRYYIYVQVISNTTEEELNEIEKLMGKKYADFIRSQSIQTLTLPRNEIIEMN